MTIVVVVVPAVEEDIKLFLEKCLMENHGYRRLKDRYKKREMTVEREAEAEYEKRVCKIPVTMTLNVYTPYGYV